jgi:hypothetical protein
VKAVNAGIISINGVAIKNVNASVIVGDFITINSFDMTEAVNIPGLLIDYNKGLIFVQAIPQMFNNVLSHLHQEMFVGDVNSFMLNPMNH